MFTNTLLSLAAVASAVVAAPANVRRADPKCTIVFDGRVPKAMAAADFDSYATNTIFNPEYVIGNDLKWSGILQFPEVASRFDGDKYKAVEVTISNKSIFQKQNGFRRAGLQFLKDASDGEGGKGVKTLHWSVKQDAARPLNLTHEYLNVWHEAADYSNNQIQFQTGSIIGKSNSDKNNFKILDRNGASLYSVPIDNTAWQNFAVTLDYNKNQATIYYSTGTDELKAVASNKSINLAGGGQFQIGILKKPTGSSDVVNSGYQSPNTNEGQIYGGLFLEDSADGCVSL